MVAMLSLHRRRGGHPRAVLQLWDRCHPRLPTGWMRSGPLLSLSPGPKNLHDNDLRPLTHTRSVGLMTARSLSPQAVRMLP